MFQQTSALPRVMDSWLCVISLEGSGILQRSQTKPNCFVWALLSLEVHPTVRPQKEDVDLFMVCSFFAQANTKLWFIWSAAASEH